MTRRDVIDWQYKLISNLYIYKSQTTTANNHHQIQEVRAVKTALEREAEGEKIEMGLSCFACFDGGSKQQRREEERLASAEVRAKAAEAAQKRY